MLRSTVTRLYNSNLIPVKYSEIIFFLIFNTRLGAVETRFTVTVGTYDG